MSKVKTIAAVIVILGILVLLFGSSLLNIPFIGNIGKYINLPSFVSLPTPTQTGNVFSFSLTSLSNPLDGQSFTVQNSNIALADANFASLQINGASYQPASSTNMQIYNFDGEVQFSYGTIVLNGDAGSVVLNSVGITSASGQRLKINSQFSAANYTITSLSKQPLVLQSVYGTLAKTTGKSANQTLQNDTIEINGFTGSIQLSGNYLITGSALSIKGSTFSWTG